jgi:hypothetical protein
VKPEHSCLDFPHRYAISPDPDFGYTAYRM